MVELSVISIYLLFVEKHTPDRFDSVFQTTVARYTIDSLEIALFPFVDDIRLPNEGPAHGYHIDLSAIY